MMGTQKNCLNEMDHLIETVLLSTQNLCFGFYEKSIFYLETCLQVLDRLAHIQLPYFIFCLLRLMIMLILTLIIHRTGSMIVDQGPGRGQDEPFELVEMPELMKKPREM